MSRSAPGSYGRASRGVLDVLDLDGPGPVRASGDETLNGLRVGMRGFALGINQVAAIAGQFIGLVAGGLLAALDWRAVFCVNVPVGIYGTAWAYFKLRDNGERHRGKIDWWGNATFALGLGAVLIGLTIAIQPYGGHTMGWTSPAVAGPLGGGILLLAGFALIESRVAEPMFQLSLFRIRAFTAGNVAGLAVAIARGGLQFMLIIWLQGIWLPLHGYNFSDTPLWAGIFLLPLTAEFLSPGRYRERCPIGSAPVASRPPGWSSSAPASSDRC